MIITIIIYVHKAISTYCSTIFVIFNPVELLLIELYHLQTVYFVHTTYIKVIYKLYSHMYIFKLYTVLLCRSLYTVQPIVGHLGNLVSCRLLQHGALYSSLPVLMIFFRDNFSALLGLFAFLGFQHLKIIFSLVGLQFNSSSTQLWHYGKPFISASHNFSNCWQALLIYLWFLLSNL